ncbi:PspC domain-containing protein [Actinomyces respiraculi]|uniref:PspC domain-containing protein n=2 Tax=Actinomycetaceae TaxID=2049 RepID=A0A7T0PWQ1_9ACTO|nr:PspC domain-containing protein [Actinomyces respiraculi]
MRAQGPVASVPVASVPGHPLVGAPGARLPLRRPPRYPAPAPLLTEPRPGRLLAGVCAGVATHLGVSVTLVRAATALAALAGGAGVILYVLLWLLVPSADPWEEAAGRIPPTRARLASHLQTSSATPRLSPRLATLLGGGAILAAGLLALAWRAGLLDPNSVLLPVLVSGAGAALAWSQIEAVVGPGRDRGAVLRLAGGVVLTTVGILLWLAADTPPRALLTGMLTGGALILGVGLVLAPVWLSANRAVAQARAAEVREAERADIAAHLHDSVLQTLTLIRRRADEPETVARLARSQERELRAWLYTDRAAQGTSAADAVRDLVGEVEDRYGAEIELVVVGDRLPDRDTEVVVAAAREALTNAVKHGAPPVSVYAEMSEDRLEVFVRDRGPGFGLEDAAAVPADRHGVRESIVGRMARRGGTATIRRLSTGTEVHLDLPASAAVTVGTAGSPAGSSPATAASPTAFSPLAPPVSISPLAPPVSFSPLAPPVSISSSAPAASPASVPASTSPSAPINPPVTTPSGAA